MIRFREENPMDGPITISWEMEDEQGIYLHHQTIYRILKRAGLIEEQSHESGSGRTSLLTFPENGCKLIPAFHGEEMVHVLWRRWTCIADGLMGNYLIGQRWKTRRNS